MKRTPEQPSILRVVAVCCVSCIGWTPVDAAADRPAFESSVERHWTSNALDSDRAIPDWYTLLRGSLERQWGDAAAHVKLGGEFQATRYDTVSIEDDRALALSAQAFRQLDSGLELRGSLTYRLSSEGDDLPIGPLTLGMRTNKQVFGAAVQAGLDLGNATTLILDLADSFEATGPTHFQDDLLLPARLDPDVNRLQLGARLTRTVGRFAVGASGSVLSVSVEELGEPPVALSLSQYALRGELAYTGADGSTAGLAVGGEFLRGAQEIYSGLRPTWLLTLTTPLPHDLELRGTCFGRYETADSDDPLASWLRRAELELGMKVREDFSLSSGAFAEAKENLLFENVERKRGVYAEAAYTMNRANVLVLQGGLLQDLQDRDRHARKHGRRLRRAADKIIGRRAGKTLLPTGRAVNPSLHSCSAMFAVQLIAGVGADQVAADAGQADPIEIPAADDVAAQDTRNDIAAEDSVQHVDVAKAD